MLGINLRLSRSPLLNRWLDLTALAFTSLCLTSMLIGFQFELLPLLTNVFSPNQEILFLQNSFLVSSLTYLVIKLGGVHPNYNVFRLFKYPPFWLAIFPAIILVFSMAKSHFGIKFEFGPWQIISYYLEISFGILSAFTFYLLSEKLSHKEVAENSLSDNADIFNSDKTLLDWISNETPISSQKEDILGYNIVADRIASLLLDKKSSSIGLIGAFGSGKSSVIKLVQKAIERNLLKNSSQSQDKLIKTNVLTCSIDGWGLSSKSVAKNILENVLDEIRKHVDCLSILGLPENYRKSLAGNKSLAGDIIAPIFEFSPNPINLLSKLDNILSASDLKIAIFMEDLDRNSSDEILRDELPALLDKLKELTNLSFVLAIGTERKYSDTLIRICEHVEII